MNETGPRGAGWYPDPAGGDLHRWWDGTRWTASTRRSDVPPLRLPGNPVVPEPAFDPAPTAGRARWPYVVAIALVVCLLGIGGCTAVVGVVAVRAARDLEERTAEVGSEVRVVECRAGELGGVSVRGTAMNGSTARSNYTIDVRVLAGDGTGSVTVHALASDVDPGQVASWRVTADSEPLVLPVRCVLDEVTRRPSPR